MPEAAAPPVPAAETTPVIPITTTVLPETGGTPTLPPRLSLEDDPNHQMEVLLAKRKTRKQAEEPKVPEKPAETPPEKAETKPADDKPRLNDLIAKALKFTPKKEDKKVETPAKEELEAKPAEAKPEKKEVEPAKTIVAKKAVAQEPLDTAKLVTDAINATARAMQPTTKPEVAPSAKPEDALKEDDRQEYIIAKYLSDTNPKFKGAEKVVLEHIKKSEDYAARWEAANPGKLFNPDDEDHNDFYDSLHKPWSDRDFRDAEIEMKAEQIVERKLKGSQAKMDKLEQDSARVELAPVVERRFNTAAVELAKAVGEDIHEKITKEGFAKLEQDDPITAQVLTETLGPLQPIIETIIQIDDAKGRFSIDPKNPLHQQWNEILVGGERQCVGMKDEQGRAFATRAEYAQMNPTQRKNHWYLTPEHLISGIVDYAAKTAVNVIKTEKDRQRKIAESLGYVPKASLNGNGAASATTKPGDKPTPEKQPETVTKPISPSVGSGAKIDDKGEKPKTGHAALMDAMTKTLFGKT
jgi:hypothetical protein